MFREASLRSLLMSLFISLAVGLWATPAAAEDAVVTDVPIGATISNPCTGEPVVFTAILHTKTHTVLTDQQSQVAVEINVLNAKGSVVLTGVQYVFTAELTSVENDSASGANGFIFRSIQNSIRLKEDPAAVLPTQTGDDFQIRMFQKLTVNSNGVVVVDGPLATEERCR
jgi:hypothetical protein